MERKLVGQGRGALTVTLPSVWIKQKGLRAGGVVHITDKNGNLLISSSLASHREVEVSLVGLNKSMSYHLVLAKYIQGYDKIILLHSDQKFLQQLTTGLIGMVVEYHSTTRTVLKSIISIPDEDVFIILKRASYMLLELARLLKNVALKKCSIDDVKYQENLMDSTLLYCMRFINKYNVNQSYRYFMICQTLESAGDHLRYIAKNIGSNTALARTVEKGVETYVKFLFKDVNKLYVHLRSFRNSISQKSFVDGLVFSLAETLYNYIGFIANSVNE